MGTDGGYADDTTRPVRVGTPRANAGLAVAVVAGAVVAVGLGVFGRSHEPQFFAVNVAGFSGPLAVKSWLATLTMVLALFQLGSALAMYRLVPRRRIPSWMAPAHVWSGRLAVLASVPVAVHCLYALEFAATETRVLLHSVFGCLFYGVFVAKMLLLTRKGLAGWVIPIAGCLVFFTLVYVWLTSAFWFFQSNGLTL